MALSSTTDRTSAGNAASNAGQYLSFTIGEEDYGIDILKVQEIRGWEAVRHLPNTPDYVKGVLDLRGVIIPVIDMRLRFKLDKAEYTATTVSIILSIQVKGAPYMIGIVVDAVSDVLDIQAADIKATPSLGNKIDTKYLFGMVSIDKRVVLLLDADNLLDPDELMLLGNEESD